MSEHTPGPWEIREGAEEVYGTAIYEVGAHDLQPLAAVSYGDKHKSADARLIAAAPDLLAALNRIGSITETMWEHSGEMANDMDLISDIAHAAVAKAKGLEP